MIQQVQLYDDQLDFEENKAKGPFGDYADTSKVYQNQGEPLYDFFGTAVYSPFGIAAGPLPTAKFIDAALRKGFDIVTLKSVRTDTFPLNPYPQLRPVQINGDLQLRAGNKILINDQYSEPLAVANSFGIPSVTPREWQPYMRESLKLPGKGQALLAAFQGTARSKGRDDFVHDHLRGIELIKQTGTNGVIEINLSCPNEGGSGQTCTPGEGKLDLACFDTDITTRIVTAVREANPDLKFIIKLAYFADHVQLRDLIQKVGGIVDGISAINTIPMPVVDADGKDVFPDRQTAGISGAPVKWAGLEMTRLLKQYRDEFGYDYKILGMSGVLSAVDFHEYREAGADIVMSVTGAMWNPNLAAEIKQSLKT
jgi:dihydroorotate dehydrogenase (NAD+) catalytic subunit